MRAAVLTEDRPALVVDDVAEPEAVADEVVLSVDACGICGSDLHVAGQVGEPGTVLGHEIAGTIAEVGPDVDERWRVGLPVVARPFIGCFDCRWCRSGRPDHCERFQLIGLERPGGFAERVAVSSRELFAAPATMSGSDRALVEPLAIARRALRRAALQPGEDVLVLGGGPIGLAVTLWARTLGAGRIVVSEPTAVRRELATTLGADHVLDPTETDLMTAVADALGDPPPVVVECTGVPGLIGDAMWQTAVEGRVVVVGICLADDTIFPWFGIQKELDVRFSVYYGAEDFVATLAALHDASLEPGAMITETVALDDLPARFAQMVETPDAGKVVLLP